MLYICYFCDELVAEVHTIEVETDVVEYICSNCEQEME